MNYQTKNTRIMIVPLNWDIENTNKTVFNRVMLTKDELKQFKEVVSSIVGSDLNSIGLRIDRMGIGLEEVKKDLSTINSRLDHHGRRFDSIDRKLRSLDKNIKQVVNFFDRGYLGLDERIDRLETHYGISTPLV